MIELTVKMTRQDLFERVWSQPLDQVAKAIGIKKSTLVTACRDHGIARPGKGYWQQPERFQRSVERKSLENGDVLIKFFPFPKIITQEGLAAAAAIDPVEVEGIHPVVLASRKHFEESDSMKREHFVPRFHGPYLDLRSDENGVLRALNIWNALIRGAERRGFGVEISEADHLLRGTVRFWETFIIVFGERIPVHMNNHSAPFSCTLHIEYSHNFGCLTRKLYQWVWIETEAKPMETQLSEFFCTLILIAEALGRHRLAVERWAREAEEQKRVRDEIEQRRREELERIEELKKQSSDWAHAMNIRRYIAAKELVFQRAGLDTGPDTGAGQWLKWAKGYADGLDPLTRLGRVT